MAYNSSSSSSSSSSSTYGVFLPPLKFALEIMSLPSLDEALPPVPDPERPLWRPQPIRESGKEIAMKNIPTRNVNASTVETLHAGNLLNDIFQQGPVFAKLDSWMETWHEAFSKENCIVALLDENATHRSNYESPMLERGVRLYNVIQTLKHECTKDGADKNKSEMRVTFIIWLLVNQHGWVPEAEHYNVLTLWSTLKKYLKAIQNLQVFQSIEEEEESEA